MVCIVSLGLLVKMTLKCIKHQPDGLLQSAIFHTNLWEKYLLEILKCVVTTRVGSRGYSDVAFFRWWVFISPLVFEILLNFLRYGALYTTGISIRGWLCFKDNKGNALISLQSTSLLTYILTNFSRDSSVTSLKNGRWTHQPTQRLATHWLHLINCLHSGFSR